MKRSPLKRTKPLASNGRRAKREAEALGEFRKAVLARAENHCERCHRDPRDYIGGALVRTLHAHHTKPRGRGGEHDPKFGAALCYVCHGQVHAHVPPWRAWLVETKPARTPLDARAGE
jgi:hypothetical protein